MSKMQRHWLLAMIAALVVLGHGVAWAGPRDKGSRVSPDLARLYEEREATRDWSGAGPFVSSNRLARVLDERVVIDAVANGDPGALRASLAALGMQNIAVFGRVVSGQLPIAAVPSLHGISHLRFARPAYSSQRVGAVTSQGDQAQRSDVARATYSTTGSGVKVGALSDSYDCLGGAAQDVSTGDLPSNVQVLQDSCSNSDEGRAMLQIVYDVAPGSSLAFATADGGQANFANNIINLWNAGSRVIVDDVIYFAEPMFQDGIIAQAIDLVKAAGGAVFSAAGNDARGSYESAFRAGDTFTDGQFTSTGGQAPHFYGGVAHNFAPSGTPNHFQSITIPAGQTLLVSFQWDSPFLSAGGASSINDLDIYVLNESNQVVGGEALNNVGGDAVEVFGFTNFGPTANFKVMIIWCRPENFPDCTGPQPGYVKYVYFRPTLNGITINEFDTKSATSYGHSNAAGAIAVGAADYVDTPAFGVNPPRLEDFSSAGGTPILFDKQGNRLSVPIVRRKPEITAPDGGDTTFFGSDTGDSGGFPNFFGTSAAAPHAAGVAALMISKYPDLTQAEVSAALAATAINMGPSPLVAGGSITQSAPTDFNFDSGYGLIQADAALGLLATRGFGVAAVLPTSRAVQVGTTATVFATVINVGTVAAQHVSIQLANELPGTLTFQTADAGNNLTGTPNTPATIQPGQSQNFVIAFTPSAPFNPTNLQFIIAGGNLRPVTPVTGLNTWQLMASVNPTPDVIALAATVTPGLIVDIPGVNGTGVFAIATSNVGAAGNITVSGNAGGLPLNVFVCRSDVGPCTPAPSVTLDIAAGGSPTFSFFVQGQGSVVPFDPANNRVFAIVTHTATGNVVGQTSVAARTQ